MNENHFLLKVEEILKNPKYFFTFVTGHTPTKYQLEILNDISRDIVIRAGRQVGKTTVLAMKALQMALTKPNQLILLVAPTIRQSDIIFSHIREAVSINPLLSKTIARLTQTMCFFKNNSKIYALPSGKYGYNIRGFPATAIIMDEGAYIKNDVYTAIQPSRAVTRGTLIVSSTPFGKQGKFYQFYFDETFSRHLIRSTESPIIDQQFLKKERGRMTEADFTQEYEAEFIEEVDTYFSRELIIQTIDEKLKW